jgi:hypothetical protein
VNNAGLGRERKRGRERLMLHTAVWPATKATFWTLRLVHYHISSTKHIEYLSGQTGRTNSTQLL